MWMQGKAFDEEACALKKWEERAGLESIRLFTHITDEDGEGDNGVLGDGFVSRSHFMKV
jgi:hypothetical protein